MKTIQQNMQQQAACFLLEIRHLKVFPEFVKILLIGYVLPNAF